ncbi:MAG: prolyl aminopeptidase [Blastocatellia bacterium]|nr:prolyl aminopeptidase [Blastocatellia bacterium]
MRVLYDPIEPYDQGSLQVSSLHNIYYEQSGNPDATPVVFLHGGPGGGSDPIYRRYFNPELYRIIIFDQRGSGNSTPHACLEENTTWHLVEDIERLREKIGIDRWVVFGGSWGSTLSLAYAETYPDKVRGLILRGIFLCRKKEIDWFYQQGASAIFPDVWQNYVDVIPEQERDDFLAAYYKRLTSDDEHTQLTAARAWSVWEGSTSKLIPSKDLIDNFAEVNKALALARIECHYFVNNAFFATDNYLIENVGKIRHVPGVIVQGRYDVVCPMMSAWDLHVAWPEAKLEIIPDAGHSITEPGIIDALVRATDQFSSLK